MKIFTVIGAIFLVAFHQTNAQPTNSSRPRSFSEDVGNRTNLILSGKDDPSNMVTLNAKISALIDTSEMYGVDHRIYNSIYRTLKRLAFATSMITSDDVLQSITQVQIDFEERFDNLSVQRDVDPSDLPSEINKLIDEFIGRYTEAVVELFDNAYTQAKNLEIENEKLAANSITLMDSLIEKVEKCLEVPQAEFKSTFQCREDTRTMLPGLAHDNAMIEIIATEMRSLLFLKLNGNTTVYELKYQMNEEMNDLMNKIWTIRQEREAAKDSTTAGYMTGF